MQSNVLLYNFMHEAAAHHIEMKKTTHTHSALFWCVRGLRKS